MKKSLIILVLFLLLIGISYNVFLYKNEELLNIKNTEQVNTKETRLRSMVLNYPENAEIYINDKQLKNINLKQKLKMFDSVIDKTYEVDYGQIHFFVSKNMSPQNLSLEKWLDQNAPYKDKTSPYSPIDTQETKINGMNAIYLTSNVSDNRGGGYYNIRTLYIFYNSDVYEIESYKLPSVPNPALTQEDIKNIKEYEKTVDEIIQSIRFVE